MNLMKMPNRNLSVIYSDQIFNTKIIKNKYFSEHQKFGFTLKCYLR